MDNVRILAVPRGRPARWAADQDPACYELQCSCCGEWLPADTEFWAPIDPRARIQRPRMPCKACLSEKDRRRKAA